MNERAPRHRASAEAAERLSANAKRSPRPRRRRPSLSAYLRESFAYLVGSWPGRLWLLLGLLVGVIVLGTSRDGFDDPLGAFVVGGVMVLLGWWMSDIPREQSDPKSEIAVAAGLTMIIGGLVALLLRAVL